MSDSDRGKMAQQKGTIPAITGEINYENPAFYMPGVLQPYKVPMLSYAASFVATGIGFPLDSLKTRLQTHPFDSTFDCFKKTIQSEGVRGLFRGIVAPLVSTAFSRSLGVTIYSNAKQTFSQMLHPVWGSEPLMRAEGHPQFAGVVNNIPVSFLAGCSAGAVVSMFACPFELTKVFQQIVMLVNSSQAHVTRDKLPTRIVPVARSIVREEGWGGLYSGFRYHLMRDSLSNGLFYGVYETAKLGLQTCTSSAVEQGVIDTTAQKRLDTVSVPLAGAMAGCFSWITVFPIDTIKAQYQRDVVGNIVRSGNGQAKLPVEAQPIRFPTRKMYKGLGPSITRSIITTSIFFSLFEVLMRNIA